VSRDAADDAATLLQLRTAAPAMTQEVGAALAGLLVAGDVVSLSGELGTGKTCIVQGLAVGLGVRDRITSPTFVLVRLHEGRVPLVHCDVYRLDTLQDVYDLGDEVLAPDVVTCIEWGDAIASMLPPDHIEVTLARLDGADDDLDARTIEVRATGARWQARANDLRTALRPWT
jgi:tRNA threonylcarbamoyladenosine biosynthesis protein TsaE